MKFERLLLLLGSLGWAVGQFNEPPGELREQTYSVLEFEHGSVNQRYDGTMRYYCTFRGKWTKERHPADFPRSPSWSAPIMISHSNGYRMWTGTETATLGVESIAEVSNYGAWICVLIVCMMCTQCCNQDPQKNLIVYSFPILFFVTHPHFPSPHTISNHPSIYIH
jgi:hypothetical protein